MIDSPAPIYNNKLLHSQAEVCPRDAERQKKNWKGNRDGYKKKYCILLFWYKKGFLQFGAQDLALRISAVKSCVNWVSGNNKYFFRANVRKIVKFNRIIEFSFSFESLTKTSYLDFFIWYPKFSTLSDFELKAKQKSYFDSKTLIQ